MAAYICDCANGANGYNGTNCEIGWYIHRARQLETCYKCRPRFLVSVDINECASNPCQNGGVCSDLVNGFVCTCAGQYIGTLCEIGKINKGLMCFTCGSLLLLTEPNITFPCSDVFMSSNCSEFVECLEAAFPCSHSYGTVFLLPLCQLTNTTTTSKTWASAASSCLIAQIQEYFRLNYTSSPSPSECTKVQQFMFHSQRLCLNVSLCSSNMSSVDAGAVSQVFAMSARLRDENIQQMLSLINLCPTHSLDTLATSLKNEGFVICLRIELSSEENRTRVQETARIQLQDLIVMVTGRTSDLNAADPNICPLLISVDDGRQRRSIVEKGMMRLRRNADNATEIQLGTVIQLAFVSRGENAISVSDLCGNSSSLGNATLSCSVCGNGVLYLVDEFCDDGNNMTGDGCSSQCVIEPGYDCNTNVAPTVCVEKTCGDGVRVSGEDCDNRKAPGCSNCLIVQGFTCHAPFFESSACFSCGNGKVEEPEECDDGPGHPIDGCTNMCTVNDLWECTAVIGQQSVCEHSPVDMNAANHMTLNPPVIIFDPNLLAFFLIQDPRQLDIGMFNSTVWNS